MVEAFKSAAAPREVVVHCVDARKAEAMAAVLGSIRALHPGAVAVDPEGKRDAEATAATTSRKK